MGPAGSDVGGAERDELAAGSSRACTSATTARGEMRRGPPSWRSGPARVATVTAAATSQRLCTDRIIYSAGRDKSCEAARVRRLREAAVARLRTGCDG